MKKSRDNQRALAWEGCYNVRDLGGLSTGNGWKTLWRAIIRSDTTSRLTPTGQQALRAYGVKTIIDLRGPHELAENPSPFSNSTAPPTYRNAPLESYEPEVVALMEAAKNRTELYTIMLDNYAHMVAGALRAVALSGPGGILIHCHSGLDRTGIVAALMLSLAGVPQTEIGADYAASQEQLWPLYEKLVAEAGDAEAINPWPVPNYRAEFILDALDHIADSHGSIRGYLRSAGLSGAELDALQRRLRP